MASLLLVATTIVLIYFSTFVYNLIRNLVNARKTGFPFVVVPLDPNHSIWQLTSIPLLPFFEKCLPKFVRDRVSLTVYGWEFREKLRPFKQYAGPQGNDGSYMLVTCGGAEFWTRDPEIVMQVLGRPNDFNQSYETVLFMSKFGHNVVSTNGDQWARQRKIIASVINERISKVVFQESIRQTEGLLKEIQESSANGATETNRLFDMVKKVTIHVLNRAGMGTSVSWNDSQTEKPEPGFRLTYTQAVNFLINNLIDVVFLPPWLISYYPSFLPGFEYVDNLKHAIKEFPVQTSRMLEEEQQRLERDSNKSTSNNVMSQLLQASAQSADPHSSKKTSVLSEEEIMGNLFFFTAAGFDTTANTISYALVLLARYPSWQTWVLSEIDAILPTDPNQELDYAATFPKIRRVLAFMLETLRLFSPLVHLSKNSIAPQTIETSRGRYWIPPNTTTFLNVVALHLNPGVWAGLNLGEGETVGEDDAAAFRPSRWINPPGAEQPLFQPPRGTYIPWSAGPRVCPGQKMAQVEFVSIFLTLLRQHRIEAVELAGESRADVERRLDATARDSQSVLTLQMNSVYGVSGTPGKGLTLRLTRRR